jgi:glycosyltransferase involved in cell wall biosynthesis
MITRSAPSRPVMVTWCATARGGAERSTAQLCAALEALKVPAVTLLFLSAESGHMPLENLGSTNVIECRNGSDYARCFHAVIKRFPDTIVLSSHRTYRVDVPAATQAGATAAVIFRGLVVDDLAFRTLDPNSLALEFQFGRDLDRAALSRAAALIGISEAAAESLAPFAGLAPVTVLLNRIDQLCLNVPVPLQSGIGGRFVAAGRFVNWKRFDRVIEGFGRACAGRPDVELTLIGDGPELEALERQIAASPAAAAIRVMRWQDDLRALLARAECLAHFAPHEGFGRVVAEAQAMGLPVVGVAAGGVGEIVIDGQTGCLVGEHADPGIPFRRFLSLSRADRVAMGRAARKRATKAFSPQSLPQQVGTLLANLDAVQAADTTDPLFSNAGVA